MKKMLSIATALGLVLASLPISFVSAEENRLNYDIRSPHGIRIVMSVNDNGDVLLSDSVKIKQSMFQAYSGEDFNLELGDVVNVSYEFIGGTAPAEPAYNEGFSIEYLGKVTDLYPDDVKELTFEGKDEDGYEFWTDADGVVYDTNAYNLDYVGYSYNIHPDDFSIGDTALCVIATRSGSEEIHRALVILEKTSEAEYTPGDATGDGKVNLLDVVAVNQNIMVGKKLAPAGIKAADLNGDGILDASESLHLLKYTIGVVDSLQLD